MTSIKQLVKKYIYDSFVPGSVILEDFPSFPGGQIIKDGSGAQLLIYYDIAQDCIRSQSSGGWSRRETW